MVYTHHHISVDQRLARGLRSNDAVHLLVDTARPVALANGAPARAEMAQQRHRCLGLLSGHRILFQADVRLAPLQAILGRGAAARIGPAATRPPR